jgi:hypothetical protein
MGEAGRALVESGMSMEHSLDRYARLYREMARG